LRLTETSSDWDLLVAWMALPGPSTDADDADEDDTAELAEEPP